MRGYKDPNDVSWKAFAVAFLLALVLMFAYGAVSSLLGQEPGPCGIDGTCIYDEEAYGG